MRSIGALLISMCITGVAHAEGDPAKGEQSFRVCSACHAVGPGAKNKVGPELNGVVGRKWGAAEGYGYSSEIVAGGESGKVWDETSLSDYVENPKHLVPHGKMSFSGMKSEIQRADLIAYLKQFDRQGSKK